eukprot:TRINITY_DN5256_c1_g1_i2.p1 TRINITY_DN5256_c1_g1~~TRINITY_DN5256_c1_g1_i2.p1  ORF type:complete len:341 (+),score=84.88 TRINITY_DN5256_c1_g1_i2:29-1051(+)
MKKAMKLYYQGLCFNDQGNWGLSEEAFLRALVELRKLKKWDEVIACYTSLGNVCYSKGDLKSTLSHWREGLDLLEQLNKKAEAGRLCLDMGDLHHEKKMWYAAGDYYTRAVTLFEEEPIGSEKYLAKAHYKLGNVCYNQKRFPDALKHYQLALPVLQRHGKTKLEADVLKAFGQIRFLEGDWNAALSYLQDCLKIFVTLGREEDIKEVESLLTTISNSIERERLAVEKKHLEKQFQKLHLDEIDVQTSSESENDSSISNLYPNSPAYSPATSRNNVDAKPVAVPSFVPSAPKSREDLKSTITSVVSKQRVEAAVRQRHNVAARITSQVVQAQPQTSPRRI